jgi:ankyrin repeat protein
MSDTDTDGDEVIDPSEEKLYTAVHDGDVNGCIEALENGASVDYQKFDGYTPLHIAAQEGHVNVVEVLLARKPDVNIQTNDKDTALMRAVRQGHHRVVSLLLAHKASLDIKEVGGETCLHVAVSYHQVAVINAILNHTLAIIDEQNDRGETALHVAVNEGRKDVVECLLKRPVNIDVKTHEADGNQTALHRASIEGKANITKMLVEKGANYTLRNGRGKTPMEEAVESEHETCIEILSEASGRMFEAMVLLRKEKEQLKRRIDELNVEHERAMSHSRQVHQLQSKQQAHMYKDKIRNATADMAHEHEVAMGALQSEFKMKVMDDDILIKGLKIRLETMEQEFTEALDQASERIQDLTKNGPAEYQEIKKQIASEYESKLEEAKKEQNRATQKVTKEAHEAMKRMQMTLTALQNQNKILKDELAIAQDDLLKNLGKKDLEMTETAYQYEKDISSYKRQVESLKTSLQTMATRHQEEKSAWVQQKHFELAQLKKTEAEKKDKVISNVVQAQFQALKHATDEQEIQKWKEVQKALSKSAAVREITESSETNVLKLELRDMKSTLEKERKQWMEDMKNARFETLTFQQRNAFNVFKSLVRKKLLCAWHRWADHILFLHREEALRQKVRMRWKAYHLGHFFYTWEHWVGKKTHEKHVIKLVRNKLLHHTLHNCFDRFRSNWSRRRTRNHLFQTLMSKKRTKYLILGFHRLEKGAALRTRHRYILQMFKELVTQRGKALLLTGMNSWKEHVRNSKQFEVIAGRFAKRWTNMHKAACFHGWYDNVHRLIVERQLMERAVKRIRQMELHRIWTGWQCFLKRRKHTRQVLYRILNLDEHGGRARKEHDAFFSWKKFIDERKMTEILDARCAADRKMRNKTVDRVIRTIKHCITRHMLKIWVDFTTEERRCQSIIDRVRRRIIYGTIFSAYRAWFLYVERRKHERHTINLVKKRIMNHTLHRSFSAWYEHSSVYIRVRRLIRRLMKEWTAFNSSHAFMHLAIHAKEERNEQESFETQHKYNVLVRKAAKRTILKLVNQKLHDAFAFWLMQFKWLRNVAKLKEKVVRRMKYLEITKTFYTWTDFVSRRDRARKVIRMVLGDKAKDIEVVRRRRGWLAWQHFVLLSKEEDVEYNSSLQRMRHKMSIIGSVLKRINHRALSSVWRKWEMVISRERKFYLQRIHHRRVVNSILRKWRMRRLWPALRAWQASTTQLQRLERSFNRVIRRWTGKRAYLAMKKWKDVIFGIRQRESNRMNAHRLAKKMRLATEEISELRAQHQDALSEARIEILSLKKQITRMKETSFSPEEVAVFRTQHRESMSQSRIEVLNLKKKGVSNEGMNLALLKCAHEGLFDNADIAETLITHGAIVNCRNDHGNSPLHIAAGAGSLCLVSLLVEKGANMGLVDYNGRTALQKAHAHKHPEVVNLLLMHGAKKMEEKSELLFSMSSPLRVKNVLTPEQQKEKLRISYHRKAQKKFASFKKELELDDLSTTVGW